MPSGVRFRNFRFTILPDRWHFQLDVCRETFGPCSTLCLMNVRVMLGFAAAALALSACVRFRPLPLEPEKVAAALENRTLTNTELKVFLEKNLGRELTSWPLPTWDLEALTLASFYYHPSLEVARADWQVLTAGERTAGERPNPTVTPSATYEPAQGAFSPWIPALIFDFPVETAHKRQRRVEQATHLSASARWNIATTAWQVRSNLRTRLLDFSTARQRIELLEQMVHFREELVRRLDSQYHAGAISSFELNTARLGLMRAQADLADGQRILAETRPALADALGIPASALAGIRFTFALTVPAAADALSSRQAREMALLGRSDIRAALSDYAATQSLLQLEIAKQYPDIHLTPGYLWNAGSTGEHDWQLGATIELPVLNQHRGPIAEAAARRTASAARFTALQAKVLGEIDFAIASFRATVTNVSTLEALAAAQSRQEQLLEAQFKAGAADQLEVLASRVELNTVELTRFEAQVKLQHALGLLENAVQRPFEMPPAIFQSSQNDAR